MPLLLRHEWFDSGVMPALQNWDQMPSWYSTNGGGTLMKHQQAIYHQYPVSDNSWMMAGRIVEVPPAEPQIVVGLDEIMGWSDFMVEDWPSPCLN